ncbi:actin-like protein arp8 [Fusarium falciforme]|nr:actin-like protein arp8 [Fusarium falciforme]
MSVDNVVGSETPRSVTGLSVDPRDVADEEDEDEEGEDEDEDEDDNDVDNEDENDK